MKKSERAFSLGKLSGFGFYGQPVWLPNVEEFEFVSSFNWAGPVKSREGDSTKENYIFYGTLKENIFATIEEKIFYIKGVLDTYIGRTAFTEKGIIELTSANGINIAQNIRGFIRDICLEKDYGEVQVSIETSITTIPSIVTLKIKSSNENFINLFKNNKK